jgi:hypothetical protein
VCMCMCVCVCVCECVPTHFQPGQRRAVGMPFSACSMWRPHPAQVINPHWLQSIARHIARALTRT